MISLKDFYNVMTGMLPLYVAMILGYGSIKWWKIFTIEQSSGINKFVAIFATPLLAFHFISTNNPFIMNYKFIFADFLQKMTILFCLTIWSIMFKGSFDWYITIFALSTLPNTLVIGIPLLEGMYGGDSRSLMIQVVVLQALVWYTLLLLLYEFRGAKMLICDQFCDNGGLIRSFKVDSDVVSLDGTEPLETHAEVMEDGKLCVQILRSPSRISWIPYPSSRNQSFRGSSFRQMEFSNFVNDKENGNGTGPYFGIKRACCVNGRPPSRVYPVPSEIGITAPSMVKPSNDEVDKNNQKIARSTSAPLPQGTTYTSKSANIKCNQDFGLVTHRKDCEDHKLEVISSDDAFSEHNLGDESPSLNKLASINETRPETDPKGELKRSTMPSAGVMLRLILVMVWRKLVRNPNTYSGLIALIWSFISFRWHIEMPKIIEGSINIVSNTGIGMATFSLGLFMASQPRIIVCGKAKAVMTVVIRFFVGPVVMGAVSAAIGIRGDLLRIAIIQAALPAAIVPFVFAKEYNVHPDILSTSIISGMLLAVPVSLLYYILLDLVH